MTAPHPCLSYDASEAQHERQQRSDSEPEGRKSLARCHTCGVLPDGYDARREAPVCRTCARMATDGGSKYVQPTGEGYLSVHRVGTKSCEVHLGQAPVQWSVDEHVPAITTERGVALLPPDADPPDPIATVRITTHTGTYAAVTDAILDELGVAAGDDIRLYERPAGPGLLLVSAATDPMVTEAEQCDLCGRPHTGRGEALRCCGDRFESREVADGD